MIFTQTDAKLYAETNMCHKRELGIYNPTKKNSKIIVALLVNLKVRHITNATLIIKFQSFSLLYFTICLVTIVTFLLESCVVNAMNE